MIIERRQTYGPPLYLRVPPGHIKDWRKHCREYNACGERVYFVEENWYNHEYVPRYQQRHQGNDRGDGRNDDHHKNGHDNGRGH